MTQSRDFTKWCLRRKRDHFLLRKMHYIPNLTCPSLIFFYSCVFPIQLLIFLSFSLCRLLTHVFCSLVNLIAVFLKTLH